MAPTELPEPAPEIELPRLMGAWYVLISNCEFWRGRTHPRIEYDPLPHEADGRVRVRDSLRYRQSDLLGRVQRKLLVGVAVAERKGQFSWRGSGLLRVIRSRWCVALIDADYRWAVTWAARSRIGTAAGLDILTRDPTISQALLDEILGLVRAHPFLGRGERVGQLRRCDGLFATVQDWVPPQPYRLD